MTQFNLVAENENTTVVSDYNSAIGRDKAYQSEAELEKDFIKLLGEQKYEYVAINSEKDLISNLRLQLEILNDFKFTEKEWDSFFKTKIANPNSSIPEKTAIIQEDYIQL